eukprot:Protomagalhaensia_sp_Gyna_25__697@NODE_1327_length_1941_cov_80_285489_g1059_i0_p2_GENE_NODE_1327_length_1941_cov_80_285489_g1059_i0NODE_1327_length_1941_cov_80_285489_g1059_i0_p2_ORF_typecomplete_len196_score33_58TAXi_C/PF14541_6/8_8e08Asp/PF00026_23/0_00048Asp/PF00026_23/3_5e03_NODE_1327_length_1941_cov_80_285489_g1059_i012511838
MVDLGNEGVIEWQANSWLFRKSDKVWCSALEDNRRAQTILGMSFMKNKEVIFDRDNSYIGFVSASCPKHEALNRPQPPDAQKSGLVISDISKEGQKMVSVQRANDTAFGWYNGISSGDQQGEYNKYNQHTITPLSKTLWSNLNCYALLASWVVGGGVSIAVVGGLMATVLKSVRNRSRTSSAAYDPLTDPAPPTA